MKDTYLPSVPTEDKYVSSASSRRQKMLLSKKKNCCNIFWFTIQNRGGRRPCLRPRAVPCGMAAAPALPCRCAAPPCHCTTVIVPLPREEEGRSPCHREVPHHRRHLVLWWSPRLVERRPVPRMEEGRECRRQLDSLPPPPQWWDLGP
jgi:hypothetical protein